MPQKRNISISGLINRQKYLKSLKIVETDLARDGTKDNPIILSSLNANLNINELDNDGYYVSYIFENEVDDYNDSSPVISQIIIPLKI